MDSPRTHDLQSLWDDAALYQGKALQAAEKHIFGIGKVGTGFTGCGKTNFLEGDGLQPSVSDWAPEGQASGGRSL
jgi:hypothetical protein